MRFTPVTTIIFALALCASPVALAQAPPSAEATFSPAPAPAEAAAIVRLREQARRQYAEGDREGLIATVAALRGLDPESRDAALYDSLLRRGQRAKPALRPALAPGEPTVAARATTATAAVAAPATSATAAAATAPLPQPAAPDIQPEPATSGGAPVESPPLAAATSPPAAAPASAPPAVATTWKPAWLDGRLLLAALAFVTIGLFLALARAHRQGTAVRSASEAARHLGRGAGQSAPPPTPSDSSPSMGIVNLMTEFGKDAGKTGDEALPDERPFSESSPVMPLVEEKPRRPEEPLFPEDRADPASNSGPIDLMAQGGSFASPAPGGQPSNAPEMPYVLDAPPPAAYPSPPLPSEDPVVPQRPAVWPPAPVFHAGAEALAEAPDKPVRPTAAKARIRSPKDAHLVESDDATLAPFQFDDADATFFHSDDDTREVVPPPPAHAGGSFASDDETQSSVPPSPPDDSKYNSDEDTEELPPRKVEPK